MCLSSILARIIPVMILSLQRKQTIKLQCIGTFEVSFWIIWANGPMGQKSPMTKPG